MGILNVTPDSFSDGGRWNGPEAAVRHALELIDAGADIIDIGAESTRPNAQPVPEEEEMRRLMPVLAQLIPSIDVPVSVDTYKASVAEAAVNEGVAVINDVSGLYDPRMAETAAHCDVPLVVMASHGTPSTFKTDQLSEGGVDYALRFISERIEKAVAAGVREDNIITDPGAGFGFSSDQSMELIRNSSRFSYGRKYPVLIGPSRKRFVAALYPGMDIDDATAEVCAVAAQAGADIVRVHNAARTVARLSRRFRRLLFLLLFGLLAPVVLLALGGLVVLLVGADVLPDGDDHAHERHEDREQGDAADVELDALEADVAGDAGQLYGRGRGVQHQI
jgi:dihydropteroate synthase